MYYGKIAVPPGGGGLRSIIINALSSIVKPILPIILVG
jgi:hypothetical protein